MFSSLWHWLRQSHRLRHVAGGFAVGLTLGFPAALAAAAALEYKDYQWGGKPDWVDFLLTLLGGILGSLLRLYLLNSQFSPAPAPFSILNSQFSL